MKTMICPTAEPSFPTEPVLMLWMPPSQAVNWKNNIGSFSTGEGTVDPNDPNKANTLSQLSKTEISLYLTSKYSLEDGEGIDGQSLMIR